MSELSLEGLLERMAYSWNEKLKQMCMEWIQLLMQDFPLAWSLCIFSMYRKSLYDLHGFLGIKYISVSIITRLLLPTLEIIIK
jgi:hypothetical protein